jgi:hypothetical protein
MNFDVLEPTQNQVLAVPGRHAITPRRHNDPLVSRRDPPVNETLQIEGSSDRWARGRSAEGLQ